MATQVQTNRDEENGHGDVAVFFFCADDSSSAGADARAERFESARGCCERVDVDRLLIVTPVV
jgi:hypothetical protein